MAMRLQDRKALLTGLGWPLGPLGRKRPRSNLS
jgi:hypothetical protein